MSWEFRFVSIYLFALHKLNLHFISDVYLPDFKFWHAATSQRLCKSRDYPEVARRIIKLMHRQVGYLFLPYFTNDNLQSGPKVADQFSNESSHTYIFFENLLVIASNIFCPWPFCAT